MNGRATFLASPQLGVYSVVNSYHLNDKQLIWKANEPRPSSTGPDSDSDSELEREGTHPTENDMTEHTVPKLRGALREALLVYNASTSGDSSVVSNRPGRYHHQHQHRRRHPSLSKRNGPTFTESGFEYEVEMRHGEYGLVWFDKKWAVSYLVDNDLIQREGTQKAGSVVWVVFLFFVLFDFNDSS